jgi:chlorite dismutase
LEEDLHKDRLRLERVRREADEHAREMDARLQMIEAIASRDASQAETELALKRLGAVRQNRPLTLDTIRDEQQALEEVEQELRQLPTPPEERPGV